ncbi:MAG: hypothetical protein SGJ27_18590 [Candidatus Melainabacteria bacterium]|nr:hypothetical protein [Candidatus Melainabacteria bacterium]
MEPEPSTKDRVWLCICIGILGLSLVGTSIFVTDDDAHILLTRFIQIVMTVTGSACFLFSIILFFVKDSPDINS